jgi:cytochrome c peroxidase
VFLHNGHFHTLKHALGFYVQRDTNPANWYPKDAHGKVDKFNDLPGRLARERRHDRRAAHA